MSDQEADIHRLKQQVTELRIEAEMLKAERAQDLARFALLLQAATDYRAAHAAMQQNLQASSQVGDGADQVEIKSRMLSLRSAQLILFAATDVVQENNAMPQEK